MMSVVLGKWEWSMIDEWGEGVVDVVKGWWD